MPGDRASSTNRPATRLRVRVRLSSHLETQNRGRRVPWRICPIVALALVWPTTPVLANNVADHALPQRPVVPRRARWLRLRERPRATWRRRQTEIAALARLQPEDCALASYNIQVGGGIKRLVENVSELQQHVARHNSLGLTAVLLQEDGVQQPSVGTDPPQMLSDSVAATLGPSYRSIPATIGHIPDATIVYDSRQLTLVGTPRTPPLPRPQDGDLGVAERLFRYCEDGIRCSAMLAEFQPGPHAPRQLRDRRTLLVSVHAPATQDNGIKRAGSDIISDIVSDRISKRQPNAVRPAIAVGGDFNPWGGNNGDTLADILEPLTRRLNLIHFESHKPTHRMFAPERAPAAPFHVRALKALAWLLLPVSRDERLDAIAGNFLAPDPLVVPDPRASDHDVVIALGERTEKDKPRQAADAPH